MLADAPVSAQTSTTVLARELDALTEQVLPQVVGWRRDIHQHPELSNRELRTAKLVADQLKRLGLEVQTAVAHTGVVAVLRGGKPGAVVALRADMDALPVKEQGDLPFKSLVRTEYRGEQVDVMHACGHDNHVAILLGVAEVLSRVKSEIPGTVKFIFQPAEEGAPQGEEGGAALMIKQGVLSHPTPGAIFGLHVWTAPVGSISYRSGPTLSASDKLTITVKGKQTHASMPWGGIDPIVAGSQIVLGLQMIPSRQEDISRVPSLISIGSIHAGNRGNIIPDILVMEGTVRTFDEAIRADIKERIRRTAEFIARSAGATTEVVIDPQNPVTINDPTLTEQMLPTLRRVAGWANVQPSDLHMPSEDFAYYQQHIPGVFLFLGVVPKGSDPAHAPRNHSPAFFADEAALPLGVRTLSNLALDWLTMQRPPTK
jgi:amidohydrolase